MVNRPLLRRGRPPYGISLIEILVVLTIIGILASVIVPSIMSRPDEARVVAAKQDLASTSQGLALYRLDNLVYPTPAQGLKALVEKPTLAPIPGNWKQGGYLRKLSNDPWDRPYLYRFPEGAAEPEVVSLGADGQEGGAGVAADISSKGL